MLRLRFALLLATGLTLVSPARAQDPGSPQTNSITLPGIPASGLMGQAANDNFGRSVASAGDVNGDGYDDVIVGAPLNDAGGSGAGRAYVYFGGPLTSSTPDLTLTGETTGDNFGISVAGAGDVNGDGYADVIVGASFNDAGGADAGRAYVYYGGPTADATADLILTGEAAGDRFGWSAASAGDVNGDGYADLIVGALFNDAGGTDAGRASVYFGGPSPDATADLTLTGEAAADRFGGSVASAGDINGDGYGDVIIGAYLNDVGGTSAGRAYVFFGGASPNATPDLTFTGDVAGDQFGISVASAGDVNGDGYADVIAGANANDAGGSNAGRAYVFFGGTSPNTTADLTLTGEAGNDQLGTSVAGTGDVNGDGYDDLIVGVQLNDAGGADAGRAYVYFGGPTADATADLTFTGEATGDRLGISVAGAGDVDGDGLADLIIGATSVDTANGVNAGAAYVISNANTGAGLAEWRALGQATGDAFGLSAASAGDVNGDGYDDVIVGAYLNDAGGTDAGRAYVYFGGPGADATADLTLTGEATNDAFGWAVAGAGDVNGDGYADVIVGARENDAGGASAGRAYVYFGGPGADTTPDLTLTGAAAGDFFGISVSGAGDVNGDGYADVIVGAYFNDAGGTTAGRAYVYYGGASPNTTADLTLTGESVGDQFGVSVASAGDVNGDGYSDIIVGAYQSDAGGSIAGQAYVYYGGVSPNTTADLTLTGEAASDFFGWDVAGAGDVNGDGYADVIVGAHLNDSGGTDAGRAYVYFGGPTADATADIILTGSATGDRFGSSVAGAGDVNGDGYSDLLVGAYFNDAGGAYVYYGGASPNVIADLTFTGEAIGDWFGRSVGSAGDTNGDGRADVIVGAYQNDAAGSNAGAAYIYRATGPAAAPSLTHLTDVPGDQGGVVQIRWTRSDQETLGNASAYLVERSEPAGVSGYAWETLATVAATGRSRYSLTAPTYSDQTGTNSGVTCFQVTAEGNAGERWRSMVKCGASIDNLAPPAPASVAASASPDGDVALAWAEVTGEPDLADYDVFRSPDATCNAADPLIGSASELTFEDDATDFGTDMFYCVAAVDVHGNRSPVTESVSANPAVLAAVKVVLQGAYQSGLPSGALMRTDIEDVLPLAQPYAASPWGYTGTEAIDLTDTSPANGRPDVLDTYEVVDWVLVEIRSDPTVSSEQRAAALLLADGTLLDPATSQPYASVTAAAPGSYHVAVYHRSHAPAMTAFAIGLDGSAPGSAYDLSASASFVYGTGGVVELATGVFGLWAGDGSADGLVTAPDFNVYSAASAAGATGYRTEDYTMDGLVTAPDFNVYNANAAAGAATAVPEN